MPNVPTPALGSGDTPEVDQLQAENYRLRYEQARLRNRVERAERTLEEIRTQMVDQQWPEVTERPEVLTVEEVAVILRRSKSAIYNDIAAGTFPIRTVRLGGSIRVPRAALDRFLNGE